MDFTDDDTIELGTSGESIDTPEELKERQRLNDIHSARREARQSFKEQTDIHLNRLLELAQTGRSPVTKSQADELAARNVYRNVATYVEELSYHLQTTEVGSHYWGEVSLGGFRPELPPGCEPVGSGPGRVTVTGLSEFIGLGDDLQFTYRTYEDGGKFGNRDFPEEKTVSVAVPTTISQTAFRATNHFVEELLGLELTQENNSIVNFSLNPDGSQLNTGGKYE